MVHLRQAAAGMGGEDQIRFMYWNADLQSRCRDDFEGAIQNGIASYLPEEWEACAANFDSKTRNAAFTHIYIPAALAKCGQQLDWWLNDEGRPLRIGKISRLISNTLCNTLHELGYADLNSLHPVTSDSWREIANTVIRDAYQRWMIRPGPFVDRLSEVLKA